jgi:acetoin utilization deacetylase AcuC-like enzyme
MAKYRRLRERVQAELPHVALHPATPASRQAIERAHHAPYVARVFEGRLSEREIRVMGFPWSPELCWREQHSTGATLDGVRAALDDGTAVNLAGGTHHAQPDRGQGYCLFNDAAIALAAAFAEGWVRRALVVDLDVHQGNGTALCLADEPRAFTLSVHGARNFPFEKATSDLDVPLPDGLTDGPYLERVDDALTTAWRRADPELVIYNAGVDVYEGDKLGRLAVSADGVRERDERVRDLARAHGVPVVVTMGGGYAPDVERIVALHLQTVAVFAS